MKLRRTKRTRPPLMSEVTPPAPAPAAPDAGQQRAGLRRTPADHTIDIVRGSAVERLRGGRAAPAATIDLTSVEAAAPVVSVVNTPDVTEPTGGVIDLTAAESALSPSLD